MTNKTKSDWRGEKGKYYDYGYNQAKKDFIRMLNKLLVKGKTIRRSDLRNLKENLKEDKGE